MYLPEGGGECGLDAGISEVQEEKAGLRLLEQHLRGPERSSLAPCSAKGH